MTKEDVGREGFLERAWDWKETVRRPHRRAAAKAGLLLRLEPGALYHGRGLLPRRCGKCSCNLYEKGLIYRGERIINWCPHCKTSISDAEVEYEEQDGHFWHITLPADRRHGELSGTGHHPSGDHAGRYRCRRQPG